MIKRRIFAILKYIMVIIIVIYLGVLLVQTGDSSRSFEQVAASLEFQLAQSELEEVGEIGFRNAYGLQMDEFEGVLMYAAPFRFSADEVLLLRLNHAAAVHDVRQIIEERIEERRNDFGDYAPEQTFLLEQASIVVRGTYIFVAIGEDAAIYTQLFLDSL